MRDAYIVQIKRSPIGKFRGGLANIRIDDLLAQLLVDLKNRIHFPLEEIDDCLIGCANQAGEDNRNLARMSLLLAEYPFSVPGVTINRLCASSLDALIQGMAKIQANLADCLVIGGAEGMSRAPYVLSKSSVPYGKDQQFFDTSLGWRFPNPEMKKLFPLYSMGETAEEVAKLHNISRQEQDQFAFDSHQKALRSNQFVDEIIPINTKVKKSNIQVLTDEGPRKDTTLEKLSQLKAAFRGDGTVTAGNSSSLNDGACVSLLVSDSFLKRHNLTPLVRLSGAGIRGCHPNTMGLGPVDAVKALLKKTGKTQKDFGLVELNEAFAAQSLACIKELDIDPSTVNVKGGAIALGHPLGCSGARIVCTLVHCLKERPQVKNALATMCVGLGQGVALSLENCQ